MTVMLSWGLAAITAFPCPSSWVAAKSAWKSAKTVWSISIASVSGWKLAMVLWPKLAANTKVSPGALVAAGDACAVCVVVLVCVESFVASCVFVVALASTTVVTAAVADVWPEEAEAASVALGSFAEATTVDSLASVPLWLSLWNVN